MSENLRTVITTPQEVVRSVLFLWGLSVVTTIITFLIIFFKIRPTGATTYALHYTVLVGVDLFGSGTSLYKIPLVSGMITLVNYIIVRLLRAPSNILSFLLPLSSAIVSLVILAATVFLLRVN